MKEEILKILSPKYGERGRIEIGIKGKVVIEKFNTKEFKEKILRDAEDPIKALASFGLYPLFQYPNPIYKILIIDENGKNHTIYITGERAYIIEEVDYDITKVSVYKFEIGLWNGLEIQLDGLNIADSTNPHIDLYDPVTFISIYTRYWNKGLWDFKIIEYKHIDHKYFFINTIPNDNLINEYTAIRITMYNKNFYKVVYKDP